jgi:hypothetical protein
MAAVAGRGEVDGGHAHAAAMAMAPDCGGRSAVTGARGGDGDGDGAGGGKVWRSWSS